MITQLSKTQLAFILDIKVESARAKMCVAWCKHKDIVNKAWVNDKNKVIDDYPDLMDISILSEHLNLPTLQDSVNDITENYLKRPGSKKWILCDYPEKEIKKIQDSGSKRKVSIPKALKSLLPNDQQEIILKEWNKRYYGG